MAAQFGDCEDPKGRNRDRCGPDCARNGQGPVNAFAISPVTMNGPLQRRALAIFPPKTQIDDSPNTPVGGTFRRNGSRIRLEPTT